MSLENRTEAFNELAGRVKSQRPCQLISVIQPPKAQWEKLSHAAAVYMSRCLPNDQFILEEKALLEAFEKHQDEIKNVTPNGMIVPKRHTILEYNALVRAFADIFTSLNIDDLILSWHIPLNLRIKFGKVSEANMKRHHPTEHIHSDSWAGESSESVTVHIPIFGDVQRNHVVFYDPPQNFDEDWLKPLPSYAHGAAIAERYRKLDFVPQKGQIVLADFSTLHASSRFENRGSRVSIDTTFALKRPKIPGLEERIHPWRVDERISHQILKGFGESHLFVFPDSNEKQTDSQGGFKHPTTLKVVELLD